MRCIELFSGCGGLALGISRAGFRHELVAEIDEHAISTLVENKNRGVEYVRDWMVEVKDVRKINYVPLGESIDLVAGGPPCQPFSIGGRHLGPEDQRNMWPEAIRAVRDLNPRAFLFENVRGLLRPAFKDYVEYLKLCFTYSFCAPRANEDWQSHASRLRNYPIQGVAPHYKVIVKLINTADYGAAQQRHRVILMGVRSNVNKDWNFPKPTHSRESLVWAKYVSGSYWARHNKRAPAGLHDTDAEMPILRRITDQLIEPTEKPWSTVRDAISDLPLPDSSDERVANHILRLGARIYPGHTGSLWDQPAKALKAGGHGVPGGENMIVLENGTVRYFTLREMARLQGFPDSFVFPSSWTRSIRQIGNAVPVQVGEALGRSIARIIKEKDK